MAYLSRKMISYNKPIIKIRSESGLVIECLIDTGAMVLIFICGEEELLRYYPSAIEVHDMKAVIRGFGKGYDEAKIFELTDFTLNADTGQDLKFKKFIVLCINRKDFGFHLVLSYTVFNKMCVQFDNRVSTPGSVCISFDNREYVVRPKWSSENKGVLESVYSFTQSELSALDHTDRISQMEAEMKKVIDDLK